MAPLTLPVSRVMRPSSDWLPGPADEPGPAALHEQAVEPPLGRIAGQDDEAEQHGERESGQGHGRLPELPGQQQVGDEDERDQLDAGRDAGAESLPPATLVRVRLAQVPDDQRHQDQVDLAQVDGAQHRFGPQDGARAEQRGAQPDLVPPVAEAAEGEPQRGQQGDDVDRHRQLLRQPPRHDGDDREHQGRERGVGKRQVEVAITDPVVERGRQMRVIQRPDVPHDEPAGPVDGQVDRVHGEALGVDDRVDHVEREGYHEHTQPGPEHSGAGRLVLACGRLRAAEDRSHLANPSGSSLDSGPGGGDVRG